MSKGSNRISLAFDGFEELARKLDKLEGDLKATSEEALKASFDIVQPKVRKAIRKENLPVQGKYSTGLTEKSVLDKGDVKWDGTVGKIDIGFDFDISGLRTVILMYGTPTIDPVNGLYEAVYGNSTKKEVAKVQREIFERKIKEAMEK